MDTNTLTTQRIDFFIIPLQEVMNTLLWHVNAIRFGIRIDWREYLTCVMKYVFDDDTLTNPTLRYSECRTMLFQHGFTEEQMAYIEHYVIVMALQLMGDAHAYIKMLSNQNLITGFYWDIDQSYDLVIRISYR